MTEHDESPNESYADREESEGTNRPLRPPVGPPLANILASHPRIELEVGTGKGLFLTAAAPKAPDTFFVGIELAKKYAELAQKRLERASIANAQVFCADGVSVVCDEIPMGRLEAIHVYFPDPWWKARHKKRRVLNERMLRGIERGLRVAGSFHFWTDVVDYYDSTLDLIRECTRLQGPNFVGESDAEHDLDYRTHFERRTRLNGLPVYRARFEKVE